MGYWWRLSPAGGALPVTTNCPLADLGDAGSRSATQGAALLLLQGGVSPSLGEDPLQLGLPQALSLSPS